MPFPSTSLATLRPDIADSLEEFDVLAERQEMVATRILPPFPVARGSGRFGRIPVEQLLQSPETMRASGSSYNRGEWSFTDDSFTCQEYGWEEPVDDRERNLYADFFEAATVSAQRAMGIILRAMESRIASQLFNATTFAGQTAGVTNEWDDAENATPIDDVESAVQNVYSQCGLWANALVINRKVYRNLRNASQIVDRISSSGAGNPSKPSDVTPEMLKAVFDLDYIFVAGGTENTANPGQDAAFGQIWSDEYALVCRVATKASDFREPCLGRMFHWTGDGSQVDGRVETYREEQTRSDIVRVRHDVDEKILYPEAGYLLSNITT